jgi:hypothetical protein
MRAEDVEFFLVQVSIALSESVHKKLFISMSYFPPSILYPVSMPASLAFAALRGAARVVVFISSS